MIPARYCLFKNGILFCYYTARCTHLDLDVLAVDDLYDAHDVIKHQAHFLTVVWWRETNAYLEDGGTHVT